MSALDFREGSQSDRAKILALYPAAFPDEDLTALVSALLAPGLPVVSLIGASGPAVVGNVILTTCSVKQADCDVALLGPLAVAPDRQGQGVGSALVKAGIERMTATGAAKMLVLGDPAYYGRFGFTCETEITPPYQLPDEWRQAWQSIGLRENSSSCGGKLSVPAPWRDRTLWAPA